MSSRPRRHVPVTMGSPEFRSAETRSGLVTHAWFPPNTVLPPHTHDRAIVAIMLEGSFRTSIAHRQLDCTPRCVWTEPLAETHANRAERAGARVIVIQPNATLSQLFAPVARLLEDVSLQHHAPIAADARRLVAEISCGDSVSPLAIDALMMQMLSSAARLNEGRTRQRSAPPWLHVVRDVLHARFRERLTLDELSEAADVHPCYLSRRFRSHFQVTIGEYVRRLRCEWAAERLEGTDDALVEIACAAGYSDQSHFTRQCRRYLGAGPAEYRRRTRRDAARR